VPYVRTVKTKSGATAVQVVYSSRQGSREIEHIGSAHDEAELKAAARQLELGLEPAASLLEIFSSRSASASSTVALSLHRPCRIARRTDGAARISTPATCLSLRRRTLRDCSGP
jgi:hypothetical protein